MTLNITTSDWIQILIAIITSIGIITSLYSSNKAIKMNLKITKETNRAHIVIFKDTITINKPFEYIVIKNIGNSLAQINKINYNENILNSIQSYGHNLNDTFDKLQNCCLAPQQSYKIPINTDKTKYKQLEFKIGYSSDTDTYHETYKVNLKQDKSITDIKTHNNQNELRIISNCLQEIIKRIK